MLGWLNLGFSWRQEYPFPPSIRIIGCRVAPYGGSNLAGIYGMPEKRTLERAREDAQEGNAPSTQAGEFVREEMDHIREGKHGARSTKQAIAIGLSKARRAGVELPPPKEGTASSETRRKASRDVRRGEAGDKPSPTRARATRR